MPASITFDTKQMAGWAKGAKNIPKLTAKAVRQQFKRGGNRFRTAARKSLLFGRPGITLPNTGDITGKGKALKGRATSVKRTQESHIQVKTGGRKDILFLVAYTSKFLGYHSERLQRLFDAQFRREVRKLPRLIEKEVVRLTKVELEKGVRKAKARAAL